MSMGKAKVAKITTAEDAVSPSLHRKKVAIISPIVY
jgi:hypothetical protein